MDDHMLYLLGSACGVVISHKAMMDRQTGLCKGFGFLMYANSEMAKKAVEWLNSHGFSSSFAKVRSPLPLPSLTFFHLQLTSLSTPFGLCDFSGIFLSPPP